MPPWFLKAAVQGALSLTSNPQRWNALLQKYVTRSLRLTEAELLRKWRHADRHAESYFELRKSTQAGFTALELGTGWYPIVPVGLILRGATRVITVDVQSLLTRRRVLEVVRGYADLLDRGTLSAADPRATACLHAALRRSETGSGSGREILRQLGVEIVVADARSLPLPAGSVDLFVSNNTLEHIPPEDIGAIFAEFYRLATPRAVMSNFIDMADHYANFDRSISVYNFLKYSSAVWPLFNNRLQYQNRLRVSDFRRLHAEGGWELCAELDRRQPIEVLRAVKPAPEFQRYSEEDLGVYEAWMASRPVRPRGTHAL